MKEFATLAPPLAATGWQVYRAVNSIFPPVSLFDQVADPADFDALALIEGMTNERLRHDLGELSLVPPDDRVSGRGTTSIMAAFTHLNPHGTRFSDGTYGVYYAAREIETSIAETRYHTSRFLARTDEEPTEIDMRFYIAELDGDLHDLRGYEETCAAVLNPDDYSASQRLGRLREATSNGPIYPSVRSAGGECVGVFRPILLADCRQERHLTYCWDGTVISGIYEKRDYA